jgi:hypothetical protein
VLVKGPATRYELPNGDYECIPENDDVRRFVWEHLQNMNRVLQRLKYCGATASGTKTLLCGEEGMAVGHLVSYEGRKPEPKRVEIIERWGPCKDLHDVNAFLGTVGTFRMFIKGYAEIVEPINRLKRKGVAFEWGEEQEVAQARVKEMIRNSPALKPIKHDSPNPVILAVDTSYIAVGYFIYQHGDDGKLYYSRFDSITLNEREAHFSQPKRELYGLKLALQHSYYWIAGCRNLIVQTNAKYIHGMLRNPTIMPNANLNWWIEEIYMYHFDLEHVPGKNFAADGPSRRTRQIGDPVHLPESTADLEERGQMKIIFPYGSSDILDLSEFHGDIDNCTGFLLNIADAILPMAERVEDIQYECEQAMKESEGLRLWVEEKFPRDTAVAGELFTVELSRIVPRRDEVDEPPVIHSYVEGHRKNSASFEDSIVDKVEVWLRDPYPKLKNMKLRQWQRFLRSASRFFIYEDRMYKKAREG